MFSENMASLGGEQITSTKDLADSVTKEKRRLSNVEKKVRDREDKLRLAKERQNEERQRKIEELRAQAEAAQKYREQKEEERRRRIEELRHKDNDRRHQVEERKKAIMEAEKERREYILRKNQEREARLDTRRKNEKGSIVFAFGSSTPRLLDPTDLGAVFPSCWGHRRSTSITNVAYTGAPLTRRSSERELADGPKKRATSAGGIDRQNDEESADSPPVSYRSVYRRKTDLMPTIPSPRDSSFGSRNSLYSHTPRTPGHAVSMTRLDQLAQPFRRNGEHIRAIIERERQQQYGFVSSQTPNNFLSQNSPAAIKQSFTSNGNKSMSRSMIHLPGNNESTLLNQTVNDAGSVLRHLREKDNSRSMMQLTISNRIVTGTNHATDSTTTKKNVGRFKYKTKDDALSRLIFTGSRSGDVTPGGNVNSSRPISAMSNATTVSGVVQRRSGPPARKPRPASIAVTGVSLNDEMNKQKKEKPPLPKVQSTPKRVTSSSGPLNNKKISSMDKSFEKRSSFKMDSSQKMNTLFKSCSTESVNNSSDLFEANTKKSSTDRVENVALLIETEPAAVAQTKEEKEALNTVKCESSNISIDDPNIKEVKIIETSKVENQEVEEGRTEEKIDNETEKGPKYSKKVNITRKEQEELKQLKDTTDNLVEPINEFKILSYQARDTSAERQENDMTASMIARKITTEEEAKAALAERRRLAREEAERQAEIERKRIESERHAELQRQAEEEERQRKLEEETLRLAEEQRKAEEERLLLAIQEAKKREEIEKFKRVEEEKFKAEREEAERKAKEEAEKQRIEIAQRLKREEKEREERRKRVEAIMSRTRAKGGNANPTTTPAKDFENTKPSMEQLTKPDEQLSEMQLASNNTNEEINFSRDKANNTFSTEMIRTGVDDTQIKIRSYEQSVTNKENDLIKCFMHKLTDEQQQQNQSQQILIQEQQNVTKIFPNFPNTFVQVTNGKVEEQKNNQSNDILVQVSTHSNGHPENLNKNATNDLVDFTLPEVTDQLIDLSESQVTADVNFNNNNLLTPSSPLVTSDSHDNKETPLL